LAERQLVAGQSHRGQGGSQKPAARLQNPAATRQKNVRKLRSDEQRIIGSRREFPEDLLLIACANAQANTAAQFVPALYLQERERLDSGYLAKILQECRE